MTDQQPATEPTSDEVVAEVDPLDEMPEASPRGSLALAVAAWVFAGLAILVTNAAMLLGPIGMALGLVSHAKGRRAGFNGAVAAGIATVLGMTLQFLFFGGISGNA